MNMPAHTLFEVGDTVRAVGNPAGGQRTPGLLAHAFLTLGKVYEVLAVTARPPTVLSDSPQWLTVESDDGKTRAAWSDQFELVEDEPEQPEPKLKAGDRVRQAEHIEGGALSTVPVGTLGTVQEDARVLFDGHEEPRIRFRGELELVGPRVIQSDNYVPGKSGWRWNEDGSAEFNGFAVRGASKPVLNVALLPEAFNLATLFDAEIISKEEARAVLGLGAA